MGAKSISIGIFAFAGAVLSAPICDLTLTACPKELPGGTLQVPMDVISLDARVPACKEFGSLAGTTSQPASIMFVIDNSGSMLSTDPQEARFSVVTSLIESISASNPATRVGLSIFTNRLAFDWRDNAVFRPLFPGDDAQHDSYVPLIRLDTLFTGGKRGVDMLKELLRHNEGHLFHNNLRVPERGARSDVNTDITLGFEGALHAMQASPSPKELQFIIFLSDGQPGGVDSVRRARTMVYEAGVNTPTTFTVYFQPGANPTAPLTIQTMTANIQANGYSTSNPKSAYYAINLPSSQLQSLLQNVVINQILVPATGKGVSLVIGGNTQTTDRMLDSANYVFSGRSPLNAGLTTLQFKYSHSFLDTTVKPALPRDTVFTYSLNVQRSPAAGPLPAHIVKTCRDQADLALFSGGRGISTVTNQDVSLEARLTPIAGQACANCTVQVSPSGSADRETRPLVASGAFYSGPFNRSESATPVPGDGVLQHVAGDSIVLTWTNPEIPLDIVRRSYPFQALPSALALFSEGKEISVVTADMGGLEVRLSRPAGLACGNCTVLVSPSGGADRETRPLTATGAAFNGTFVRIESVTPLPGDGILQHLASDSVVLEWVNPLNPQDRVRRSYPYRSIAPKLSLFANGKEVDTVTSAHARLEIRLTLPGGEPCIGCTVQVTLSGSADKENVAMGGGGSPFRGSFPREVGIDPAAGNGKLEHLAADSLVFVYQNPLNPDQQARRAYPFVYFANIARIVAQNPMARNSTQTLNDGRHWIISDAPNLAPRIETRSGPCCRVLTAPVNAQNPDSGRTVGIVIEVSREFTLDVRVFNNLGHFVNRLNITVPRSEFQKLTPLDGKDSRFLRLLWNGQAEDGTLAGTGVYIFMTSLSLLPSPGLTNEKAGVSKTHTVGIVR